MDAITKQHNTLNYVLSDYKNNTVQTVFFPFFPSYLVTNGVKCVAEKYALQWLFIIIFSAQKFIDNEPLQMWQIHRVSDTMLMIIADNGLGKILFSEKVMDKSLQYDYLKLLWVENLLMLPSETEGEPII